MGGVVTSQQGEEESRGRLLCLVRGCTDGSGKCDAAHERKRERVMIVPSLYVINGH